MFRGSGRKRRAEVTGNVEDALLQLLYKSYPDPITPLDSRNLEIKVKEKI